MIRIAAPTETEPITHLINIAFEVERFFIDGDRIDALQVGALFEKGIFLVIDGEAGLAGCVYVEPRGSRAYLGLLSVHPLIQGQGFGARLVQAAEDHARTQGCEAMDLRVVDLRLELPPFYRRLGYRKTGTSPFTSDTPTKRPCCLIEMSKSLRAAAANPVES